MFEDIFSAFSIALLVSFSIGPVFFVLIETSSIKGFRAALTFDLGVILADAVFIAVAYFSASEFLVSVKDEPFLFIVAALILFCYGSYLLYKEYTKKV